MSNEFKMLLFIFPLVTTDYWLYILLDILMTMHMDFWIYRKYVLMKNIFVYLYVCVNLSTKHNYKCHDFYSVVSTES